MTTGGGFAHPELLVDAAWVAAHQDDPNVVVVDCDVEGGYLRGHIAGAVRVPDNYEKDPNTGRVHILPPDQFANLCQHLGIGDDTLVIAYDNNQGLYAARLWWALTYYGHPNVKVLDGGWRRWVQEDRSISFDTPKPNTRVKFTPKVDDSIMVRVDELKAACSLSDSVLWDVRSDGEYDGSNNRGNRRAGHVPGAVHLEWFNTVDRETHRLKSPQEIRKLLNERGITPDKAVFSY
jgi:thiosulfate/3-mercaptopyruvate sulfurtransferase